MDYARLMHRAGAKPLAAKNAPARSPSSLSSACTVCEPFKIKVDLTWVNVLGSLPRVAREILFFSPLFCGATRAHTCSRALVAHYSFADAPDPPLFAICATGLSSHPLPPLSPSSSLCDSLCRLVRLPEYTKVLRTYRTQTCFFGREPSARRHLARDRRINSL